MATKTLKPRYRSRRRSEPRVAASGAFWYLIDPGGETRHWLSRPSKYKARRLRSTRDILDTFRSAERKTVWVAWRASDLAPLTSRKAEAKGERRLLLLHPTKEVAHHLLSALFRYVVVGDNIRLLPHDQLVEALASPNRQDLFIGGAVAPEAGAVVLYRGNLDPLVVPLSWFEARKPYETVPNLDRFEITDYGQTVRLGEFEAATDAILYEHDRDFRTRAKVRLLEADPSLGASIRRLRLQKGLRRSDFGSVAEKTIARIERNEIRRPQRKTLDGIAAKLGVKREDLATY